MKLGFKKEAYGIDFPSQPICNFRDVMLLPGIANRHIQGVWFRSGKLPPTFQARHFKTIINFCAENDNFNEATETCLQHFPISNDLDVYDSKSTITQTWVRTVINSISMSEQPILFHCFSGKDRTGIIAAILQKIVGVENDLIRQDYLNSDGHLFLNKFMTFLENIDHDILPAIHPDIKNSLVDTICSLPQRSRLRCGYLPRGLTLDINSSQHIQVDRNGRLCRYIGKIDPLMVCPPLPQSSPPRVQWRHVISDPDMREDCSDCDRGIASQQAQRDSAPKYRWAPLAPPSLGGVISPFNEIRLSHTALKSYALVLQRCQGDRREMHLDIELVYGEDSSIIDLSLPQPLYFIVKSSYFAIEEWVEEGMGDGQNFDCDYIPN